MERLHFNSDTRQAADPDQDLQAAVKEGAARGWLSPDPDAIYGALAGTRVRGTDRQFSL